MQDVSTTIPFAISVSAAAQMKLLRGQSHWAQLQRGTVINVAMGRMVVTSHVWLDNAMLSVQAPLQPGEVYVVPASGWFELAALSDVVIQPRLPAPVVVRWVAWTMGLLALTRKRAPSTVTFQ